MARRNLYLCDCGWAFVSEDDGVGVTPFLTSCPSCERLAQSLMYGVPQEVLADCEPVIRWYRPADDEVDRYPEDVQEHLRRGGLLRDDKDYGARLDG